ncbi:uncharacterized protein NEMAJ01_1156 [Nematocida major]|uniref:uncharacterized protein n=1 Tax=Nematocida major TaxID=1912982 RepID=UPI002008E1CC|nr:uncharacterized protein NEMAJ01_1156 [Nematocida major]KAH9386260.1 hypothetical protein NEMAJ01_1156 [Nematocida major]
MNIVKEQKIEENENAKRVQKVFKFQGVGKHLRVVKECNISIRDIEERIIATRQRVESRVEEFRRSTGQKELYDKKDEIQARLNELLVEKQTLRTELKTAVQDLKTLSQSVGEEKKKLNMKSTSELRNRINSIDSRIRERPVNSKEEKELSTEKNRIIKLLAMQDIFKEKDEKIKEMEDQKKRLEALFSVKKQEIDIQTGLLSDVNAKIGKIKKTVYPEDIKKMQEDIVRMQEEKKAHIKAKREEQAIMEKKAQEYELKAAEIELAKQHKTALIDQEKVISDLFEEKEKLEAELQGNPSETLGSIRKNLLAQKSSGAQKGKSAELAIPLHLVNQLVKFNIAIPRTQEDIDKTVLKVDEIKKVEELNFLSRKQKMTATIAELSEKIQAEKEAHKKMPRPVFPRISE